MEGRAWDMNDAKDGYGDMNYNTYSANIPYTSFSYTDKKLSVMYWLMDTTLPSASAPTTVTASSVFSSNDNLPKIYSSPRTNEPPIADVACEVARGDVAVTGTPDSARNHGWA